MEMGYCAYPSGLSGCPVMPVNGLLVMNFLSSLVPKLVAGVTVPRKTGSLMLRGPCFACLWFLDTTLRGLVNGC